MVKTSFTLNTVSSRNCGRRVPSLGTGRAGQGLSTLTRSCPLCGQAGTLLPALISFQDLHLCMTLQKDTRANKSLIYIFCTLPYKGKGGKPTS